MAQSYLEKFNGTIRKRQAEQILKLLNKQKNTGQIRTIKEFTDRLDSLIRDLNSTVLTPTIKLFSAEAGEVIDTDTFNFMLDRVKDDLEAGFEEAKKIEEVQQSHEAIARDIVLKNLKFGTAELETKVSLYEILSTESEGYDNALFSTFREAKKDRSDRSIRQPDVIFSDPKTLIPIREDAFVDPIGERLLLGSQLRTLVPIRKVRKIFDEDTDLGELVVAPASLNLGNLIDNQKGTYWVESVLFAERRSSVTTKLELDLGAIRDIGFIEIEPATLYGIVLESVDYLDASGTILNASSPELAINSTVGIRFKPVNTRKIILTFRNENYRCTQFEYTTKKGNLLDQAYQQPAEGLTPVTQDIADDLDDIINSQKTKDLISISPSDKKSFSGFEFITGFDNIRTGTALHKPVSIYVSNALTVVDPNHLALKTSETRPALLAGSSTIVDTDTTYDTLDTTFFQSSIEYYVAKRDLDENNNIIRTNIIPILPTNAERIHHERLLLTEKSSVSAIQSDIGYLQFFTDVDLGSIKVYRNGIEIPDITASPGSPSGWIDNTNTVDKIPNTGTRMRFSVRVKNPLPTDVFTVSYTPVLSTTTAIPKTLSEYSTSGITIVDLTGNMSARSMRDHTVRLDSKRDTIKTVKTELRLIIIIRNNVADRSLSAAVEDYKLLVGTKNKTKFLSVT